MDFHIKPILLVHFDYAFLFIQFYDNFIAFATNIPIF